MGDSEDFSGAAALALVGRKLHWTMYGVPWGPQRPRGRQLMGQRHRRRFRGRWFQRK